MTLNEILKGKAREDFIYYVINHPNCTYTMFWFESLPVECQFGVIQDWGDHIGFSISVFKRPYDFAFTFYGSNQISGGFKGGKEAQIEAVKQLVEIYNNKKS